MRKLILLMIFLTALPMTGWAQDGMTTDEELDSISADITERMLLFQEEVMQLHALSRFRVDIDMDMPLTEPLLDVVGDRIRALNAALNSFTVRWNTYSQAQQVYVADNDDLLNKVAQIQQIRQAVADSMAARQQQYDQLTAFCKAEQMIYGNDKTYRQLYKQAAQLSLSPKLAGRLEKVKAEEQALFADIQTNYAQAKTAAEAFPGLKLRMKGMDNKFFELQSVSTKIQEMAYKPFIQRIKDYLFGLAAVAILLLFFNLLSSKLKVIKQARDKAKSLKDMASGQHNYPTI